ncbi:hypothetical protein [Azospirillum sp. A39]|uniref:hypothetical protein n=1 Tax=Azospirillum sp. A39 TaxID=3462279 RepID=UPI004046293E
MSTPTIVEEHGSFRLIARDGRYAVIEQRNGEVFEVRPGEGPRRREADTPDGMARVVAPESWSGEAAARGLFDSLKGRGDGLARTIW